MRQQNGGYQKGGEREDELGGEVKYPVTKETRLWVVSTQ